MRLVTIAAALAALTVLTACGGHYVPPPQNTLPPCSDGVQPPCQHEPAPHGDGAPR